MPSKSPQSTQSGSGSGTGNPKANFKHSLPQQLPVTYFSDIRRRLEDSLSSETRRRKTVNTAVGANGVYDGEDKQTCQDMVDACRLLESAPAEYRRDISSSQSMRRQGSSHSLNGGHRSAAITPPTPLSSTSRPPPAVAMSSLTSSSLALTQGKTTDGLYGLNHFPPQKDVFNGPAQAFLENDCDALATVQVWQSWADARSKFFDEASTIAAEVFTFACVDETIVSVSPSTPPTGTSTSRTSPSTPFRRSPRPDYEARLQDLQSRYVRVGSSSYLHFDRALMVHVWRSVAAAHRFTHAWQRCWQAIFEHRIAGIHCPLSVAFNIQGISITVTALPPVYVDKVPPIPSVFGPLCNTDISLAKRTTRPLRSLDSDHIKGCTSPLLSAMICRLFTVLHIPQDDSIVDQYGDSNLYSGIDGRWYLLQMGPMVSHTSTLLQRTPGCKYTSAIRQELLREIALEGMHRQEVIDYSPRAIHMYILFKAIPKAVANAVALLPMGSQDSRRPEVLLRDGFLPMMLHDHGINLSYLYFVYEYCCKMAASQTPLHRAGQDGGDDDDDGFVAGVPAEASVIPSRSSSNMKHRRGSSSRTLGGGEDDGLSRVIAQGEYHQLLAVACKMEMLSRTIKNLAKLDVAGGFTTTPDFKTSTTVRLDMVNRMARLAASRDHDFLVGHVLPALKAKYQCPEEFHMTWDVMSTGSVLKILSLHLGTEYGMHEGKFHTFAPFAQKKALLMFPIVSIDAMLNKDERRMHHGVAQLWDDANRAIGKTNVADQIHLFRDPNLANNVLSPLHAAFVVRAITFSIISRTHRSHVLAYTNTVDSSYAKKGWPLYIVAEMGYYAAVMEDKHPSERCEEYRTLVTELLRLGQQATSHSSSSNSNLLVPSPQHTSALSSYRDDVPLLAVRLVHVARQMLRAQHPSTVSYTRKAVETLVALPHVDFVFHALHAQILKDTEANFAKLDPKGIHDYLHGVVEVVVSALRRWNRMQNAARYLLRVSVAMVNVPLVEECADSARVGQLAFSTASTLFGSHDGRTLLSLYIMCLCSLCGLKSAQPSFAAGIKNLRKVIDKHQTLSPSMQVSFSRTTAVHSLLTKLSVLMEEAGDAVALTSLRVALAHAERYRNAVLTLQSVGRGFVRRQMMRANGLRVPFAPPQRPSSMVYFDGQMPLTLGQAANLGISLEDESTRNRMANYNMNNDAQSDVSSITGSFVSGSNQRQRFSKSQQHHQGGPGGSHSTSAALSSFSPSRPLGVSQASSKESNVGEHSFSLMSPIKQSGGDEGSMLDYGRGGSFSLPEPVMGNYGGATSDMPRPVPRSSDSGWAGSRPPPLPALPSSDIPSAIIQRVRDYQQHQLPMAPSSPDMDDPTPVEISPPLQRTLSHKGRDVPNAWNFDVPYDASASRGSSMEPELVEVHRGVTGQNQQLSRSHDVTMLHTSMSSTVAELFALCDTDNDGVATVKQCVEGLAKLHWMPVDDLRNLLTSVAQKQGRGGLVGLFTKAKDVLTRKEFQEALTKAGILGESC